MLLLYPILMLARSFPVSMLFLTLLQNQIQFPLNLFPPDFFRILSKETKTSITLFSPSFCISKFLSSLKSDLLLQTDKLFLNSIY